MVLRRAIVRSNWIAWTVGSAKAATVSTTSGATLARAGTRGETRTASAAATIASAIRRQMAGVAGSR